MDRFVVKRKRTDVESETSRGLGPAIRQDHGSSSAEASANFAGCHGISGDASQQWILSRMCCEIKWPSNSWVIVSSALWRKICFPLLLRMTWLIALRKWKIEKGNYKMWVSPIRCFYYHTSLAYYYVHAIFMSITFFYFLHTAGSYKWDFGIIVCELQF